MRVFKLPIPINVAPACDSCHELPARMRLVIGGNTSESLCAACIGVLMMDVEGVLTSLLETDKVN